MAITQARSVAIIGAGVAGLATARELMTSNIEIVIFERNAILGGVWSDGYLNFGVQVPKELYEFPDWPLPEETPDFTPGPVMQKYLTDFAHRFGIFPHIKFNTTVTELRERKGTNAGWIIKTSQNNHQSQDEFDLVVICIGLYSNLPNIPDFPDCASFKGEVIHNSRLKSPEQLSDKKVAVIGYGKSATDAAIESAAVASQTHIIFREPHWPIPRKLAGILPFKWGLLHRLNSTLIPPYQHMTAVEKIVQGPGKPLVWFYWRLVELLLYFQCQLGSRFGSRVSLVPQTPIEIDAFGESTMVPRNDFYRLARNNQIRLHRTTIDRFTSEGLKLANGAELDLDLVIMATGWATDFSFLDTDIRERLEIEDDGFYLYRHMLNPNIPNLVFIGRASSVSSILTYSLQAFWLGALIRGKFDLPSRESMNQNIRQMKDWKRAWIPYSPARSARLIAHTQHYHDELLVDVGCHPLCKTGLFAPLKELIEPYESKDYANILSKHRHAGN